MTLFRILNGVQFQTVKTVSVNADVENDEWSGEDGGYEFRYSKRQRSTLQVNTDCTRYDKNLHIPNVAQPVLERRHVILSYHGSSHAATVIVTTHDNVRDFEHIDGILQSRHQVHVCRNNHVGNVTNNKDGSGSLSHDLVGRDTSIRAAFIHKRSEMYKIEIVSDRHNFA
jgi:hypothetical protein